MNFDIAYRYAPPPVIQIGRHATEIASANPLLSRQQNPYPPSTFSKRFKLIANVTDRAQDILPPIHGWALQGADIGAGLNSAVLNNTTPGQIFYQNGTANEVYHQAFNILTDTSSPPIPYGIVMHYPHDTEKVVGLGVDIGTGTSGITLTNPPYPMVELSVPRSRLVACKQNIPYYPLKRDFVVVKAFRDQDVPDGCVWIEFLPQCAELPELPAGSIATHEFANRGRCFEDPASIHWINYSEVR
ncbi:hypothetical protein F4815DRAFT_494484 [Daldinia loculata]|nr:hypothetical protein F4815DRAFT_494484 [Daldinia loculata]